MFTCANTTLSANPAFCSHTPHTNAGWVGAPHFHAGNRGWRDRSLRVQYCGSRAAKPSAPDPPVALATALASPALPQRLALFAFVVSAASLELCLAWARMPGPLPPLAPGDRCIGRSIAIEEPLAGQRVAGPRAHSDPICSRRGEGGGLLRRPPTAADTGWERHGSGAGSRADSRRPHACEHCGHRPTRPNPAGDLGGGRLRNPAEPGHEPGVGAQPGPHVNTPLSCTQFADTDAPLSCLRAALRPGAQPIGPGRPATEMLQTGTAGGASSPSTARFTHAVSF